MESVTIPDSVTTIGNFAFQKCRDKLTSINISANVTSIGIGAFSWCKKLETITVDSQNTVYKSEGNCIIEKATNQLIAGCKGSVIPETVTSIGAYAFYYMPINSNFTLPNSITSIGQAAFMYSETLTSITLPSSLKQIDDSAFYDCEKLTAVVIPASVESIGYRAFCSCDSLNSVTFSEDSSLKSIGMQAFSWCKALESITIPASVESIGEGCFYICSKLNTVEIADGSKLKTIGDAPFKYCDALTTITMKDNGTFYAENNLLFEKNGDGSVKRLIYGFEVTLPTDEGYTIAAAEGNSRYVGRNGSFSFTVTPSTGYNKGVVVEANSTELTQSNGIYTISNITANQKVTLVGAGECTHEGATFSRVENDTKHKCSLCDKVLEHRFVVDGEHPEQHKCSDCGYAEAHTENQKTVKENEVAPTCTKDGSYDEVIYCSICGEFMNSTHKTVKATGHTWDAGKVTKEPTATRTGIKTYTCKACGTTKTEEITALGAEEAGTVLTDSGTRAAYKVTNDNGGITVAYEKPVDSNVKIVKIPDTVTVDGITYQVTSVSAEAFKGCKKLTKVTIGKNVTEIGAGAFNGCSKLKTVTMGANVETIADRAFYKCTALTKITIPSKVSNIGKRTFYGCKKLKSITIKTKLLTSKTVGSKAFKGIHAEATIKVPKANKKTYKTLLQKKGVAKSATVK